MKKNLSLAFISGILLFTMEITGTAQPTNSGSHTLSLNIPEVALLDLESNTNTSLALSPFSPTEAGNALDFSSASDHSIWLNYSSVTGNSGSHRKISAYVEGTIPDGMMLSVKASSYSGNGNGRTGIPTGKVHLSENTQDIITHIGSCYTGDGVNNGHLLTYSLEPGKNNTDYETLAYENSASLHVIYTLTDDN